MTPLLFCIVALWTSPCSDDVLAWDAVPDAVSYHVEARGIDPGVATVLWTVHTTMTEYMVACQLTPVMLYVWAVDAADNHSAVPATWLWKAGPMRRLDDTNMPPRPRGEPMCGGPGVIAP